jgi:hypothetical protein
MSTIPPGSAEDRDLGEFLFGDEADSAGQVGRNGEDIEP